MASEDVFTQKTVGCGDEACAQAVKEYEEKIMKLEEEKKCLHESDEAKTKEINTLKCRIVSLETCPPNAVGKEASRELITLGNAILKIAGGSGEGMSR